jgi:hypothetical protein
MKTRLFLFFLGAASWSGHAQQLLPEIEFFSKKDTAYLVTKAGERVAFRYEKLERRKGVIEAIQGLTTNGQPLRYEASQLRELALPPAERGQGIAAMKSVGSVTRARHTDLKALNRDLVYFYPEYLDDQKRDVLLQLLNPGFDSRVRVYHDPASGQTRGVGIGGIPITGGIDKGYYVRANERAYRLRKAQYGKQFRELFGDCPGVAVKYPGGNWRDLPLHVFHYDQACQ